MHDDVRAKLHLQKAEHNLLAADCFRQNGFSDWSGSALFYSIYHCFLAVLAKRGYESHNPECTFALVGSLVESGMTRISKSTVAAMKVSSGDDDAPDVVSIRERFQYGVETSFDESELYARLLALSKDALEAAKADVFDSRWV